MAGVACRSLRVIRWGTQLKRIGDWIENTPWDGWSYGSAAIVSDQWTAIAKVEELRMKQQKTTTTSLGQKGQDGLDASTAADIRRIGVADRPHHGAEKCLAEGAGVRHSNDSVLHQPWRPTSVREPPARARTREAYAAAAEAVGGIVERDVSDDTPSVVHPGCRRRRP